MKTILTMCFVLSIMAATLAQETPFPEWFENVTVVIEKWDAEGKVKPHGAGFLYFDSSTNSPYLVTNHHLTIGKDSLQMRYNATDGSARNYTLKFEQDSTNSNWRIHPEKRIDLLLYRIPKELPFKTINSSSIKLSTELKLGDEVYFIGFPISESTTDKIVYPLLRHGIIAYFVKERLLMLSPPADYPPGTILIDGTVQPGNSGGPVISFSRVGTQGVSLIGVIQGHLGTSSGQNSVLGVVIPTERILEVIAAF